MKRKIGILTIILIVFAAGFAMPSAFAGTEPDIRLYTDAQRTQEAESVSLLLGGGRIDLYYTVKGVSDENASLRASAADENVVNVFVLSGKVCFVAESGLHSAGSTDVTVTADGCEPRTIRVSTDYAAASSLTLKIDGEKPGYYLPIVDSLTVEFGVPRKIYAEAHDASGNTDTLNPVLDYIWSFAENGCGASFADGSLSVTGTGTADATVSLKLGGTDLGISRTFRITSNFQQMAADVDISADGLSITGIRYTAGSRTVSLVYRENGENLSRDIALDDLKLGFTVSNSAYTDPEDIVWSSTDPATVSVNAGLLTFGENLSGSKQVTITVTNRDKTVMDSILVVVTVEKPEKTGCGAIAADSDFFGPLTGLLLLCGLGVAVMKKSRRNCQ